MIRLDVDNNGSVDLGDASAVSIALDLQFSQIADASGVLNPPTLATLPPWVDVNGDNILAPRDALSVMWNVRYGALPDSAAADALASGPLTAGLVVTAAPEPGGLTLEASGLAILLATFCRRKRRETRNLGGI